jgi:hypothetical protein
MKHYFRILLWSLLWFLALPAGFAAANAPIMFSREEVVIRRAQPVQQPLMPWQSKDEATALPDITLDAEIRDASTLVSQNGWFNLSSPNDHQAVMLLMRAEEIATLTPSSQYAALDVLMIDKEGIIREIYPRLKLAELSEPIVSRTAMLGLLFLRGGAHETLVIKPGDSVIYRAFRKPPVSLSIPAQGAETKPAASGE